MPESRFSPLHVRQTPVYWPPKQTGHYSSISVTDVYNSFADRR